MAGEVADDGKVDSEGFAAAENVLDQAAERPSCAGEDRELEGEGEAKGVTRAEPVADELQL